MNYWITRAAKALSLLRSTQSNMSCDNSVMDNVMCSLDYYVVATFVMLGRYGFAFGFNMLGTLQVGFMS